jgi:hypothetical protein
MRKILPIVLVAVLAPYQVAAQAPSDAVKAIAGEWEISTADREKACNLTFRTDPVKGGFKVEFESKCAGVFPVIKEVEAWALVKDDLRLLDAKGRVVFDFTEVESGMYEAERKEGLYFLQGLASAALPPARAAEDMFGEWVVARAGKPVCTLALTSNGAGGELGYARSARLRWCDRTAQSGELAHGPGRSGAVVGERSKPALRGIRAEQMAARSRVSRGADDEPEINLPRQTT